MLAFWAIAGFLMNGILVGSHERATIPQAVVSVLFSTLTLIFLCLAVGRLIALLLRDFGDENHPASLRIGFGVISGAVVGTLASGVLTVSLRSGPFGVYDATASYWLWGPVLALTGGIVGLLLERRHDR